MNLMRKCNFLAPKHSSGAARTERINTTAVCTSFNGTGSTPAAFWLNERPGWSVKFRFSAHYLFIKRSSNIQLWLSPVEICWVFWYNFFLLRLLLFGSNILKNRVDQCYKKVIAGFIWEWELVRKLTTKWDDVIDWSRGKGRAAGLILVVTRRRRLILDLEDTDL